MHSSESLAPLSPSPDVDTNGPSLPEYCLEALLLGHSTAANLLTGQPELSCATAWGTENLTKLLLQISAACALFTYGLWLSERTYSDSISYLLLGLSQGHCSYPCEICGVKAEVTLGSACQDYAISK